MWNKIDNKEIVLKIKPGNIITDSPGDSSDQYEIKKIGIGYITALHINGIISIRIFPEKELMSGIWYVKK